MATAENGSAAPPEPARKAQEKPDPKSQILRVYQHSNFFYWWIVWAYGFICGLLTYFDGRTAELFEGKKLYVHSSAWVGISFVALLLIVIFFTNYRVKGANSVILILGLGFGSLAMYYAGAWGVIFRVFPALLIFMNLAFYISLSTALLLLWSLATFGLDRLTYWEFTPGQVTRYNRIGEGSQSFDAHGLHLDRVADDILINKILGLRFLGYGTADLKFTTSGAVRDTFTIDNVWRANLRDRQIRDLIVVRPSNLPT
jgi:hypothetical protein